MNTKDFNVFDKIIAKWRLSKIVREVSINDDVLDFGCGSQGYFLKIVSDGIKSGVGIDYDVPVKSEGNLKYLKYKYIDRLPFESGVFDKVVMLAVLEHVMLDGVKNLFCEFARVLRKNGQIILTTPTPMSKPLLEFLAKTRIINKAEIEDHKKYYNKADIEQLAAKTGFEIISYKLFQFGLNSVVILEKNNK
ncbi:MAG: class I SAM-dependent methyltransferase [Candidatus Shapirobacteria bacterium]